MQPTDARWWNGRCWDRAILDRLQDALSDCNESLRLKPDAANTLDSRGLVYLKLGEIDKSLADYNAALKLDPRLSDSLYGRSLAERKKGDTAAADTDLAAAKALRPNVADEFAKYGVN